MDLSSTRLHYQLAKNCCKSQIKENVCVKKRALTTVHLQKIKGQINLHIHSLMRAFVHCLRSPSLENCINAQNY